MLEDWSNRVGVALLEDSDFSSALEDAPICVDVVLLEVHVVVLEVHVGHIAELGVQEKPGLEMSGSRSQQEVPLNWHGFGMQGWQR